MAELNNKKVVITGTTRGMGKALATKLAENGAHVIMVSRDKEKNEALAQELMKLQGSAEAWTAEMSDEEGVKETAKKIAEKHQVLDILINNASINNEKPDTRIGNIDTDSLRYILDVNLFAPIVLVRELLPSLKKSKEGRIINFSSGLGKLTGERPDFYPSYSISKTALNAVTKFLDQELSETDESVKAFSLDPGWVRTDLGGPNATFSIEEGIDTPYWLCTEAFNRLESGAFYYEREVMDW
ncbi:MAG: SDR family NAD(P)-dependent oxidoreductase [Chitinivibrionales bacterium]